MILGGFEPFSLSDFPGHVASVVFTKGCNFACPWCHNKGLIAVDGPEGVTDAEDAIKVILDGISARAGRISGVVVSGGEPTIHHDLPAFIQRLKSMGLAVKLDTNGSNPGMLEALFQESLIDYVAMDIKAPLARYPEATGGFCDTGAILRSIRIVSEGRIPHHFRTTLVPGLLDEEDIMEIRGLVPEGSSHLLQPFRTPEIQSRAA